MVQCFVQEVYLERVWTRRVLGEQEFQIQRGFKGEEESENRRRSDYASHVRDRRIRFFFLVGEWGNLGHVQRRGRITLLWT